MTTTALRLGTPLLLAALCLSPALAQDRALSHAEDGETTTLTARPQGDTWRVELTRRRAVDGGTTSEQRLQLTIPRTADVDRKIDQLFRDAPDDPDEWTWRLEDVANVDIDYVDDFEDIDDFEEVDDHANARDAEVERDEAGADRVWLKDGGLISGELLTVDATSVRVKTASGGQVNVPRDTVRRIELAPAAREHATFGASVTDQPGGGARVQAVKEGAPAARSGVRPGDVIVAFDGQPVQDCAQLRQVVAAHEPGDSVTLSIVRGDQRLDLKADLTSSPKETMGPY